MALTRPRYEQLNTATVADADPITVLNQGSSNANVDIGFLFNRSNGIVSNVALYWSESAQSIVTAYTTSSGSTDYITVGSYANVTIGNLLMVNGSILGVVGNLQLGNLIANTGVYAPAYYYANGAPFVSSTYGNLEVAAYIPIDSTIVTIGTRIDGANAAIVTANTALKSYVDGQDSAITTAWTANAGIQADAIAGANAAIITANTALKAYADNAITTANTALKAYTESTITTANTALKAYTDDAISTANTALKAYTDSAISTANTALKAYTDSAISTANTALKAYTDGAITTANTALKAYTDGAITTANTALKGYTDAQTGAITTAWTANAATQQGLITTLQSQVYSNSNVDAHLSSSGSGNITISSGTFGLTATGPGATTVGSSTAIPVITTDAYGRIVALTTSAVSSTLPTAGTTGTGSVNLLNQILSFSSTNGVLVAASGNTIAISTPQNIQTTASPTFAGITTTGNTVINSTSWLSGVTKVTNATASTGAGNGALVVTGGLGVSGTSNFGADLYVTGNIYTANLVATTTSTLNTSSPMAYFQVTPSYPYNFETGFYSHFVGGPANVYAHTGFVRNHNNNYWTLFSNVRSEPSSATINFADAGLIYDTLQLGALLVSNATPSTSTTTGALVVTGGIGTQGNLNANGAAFIGYGAAATNLTSPTIISTASSQSVAAGNYYVQTAVINSSGTGSSDMAAYANNVTDGLTGFVDAGFTGNLFADPAYTITKANDGYLFASALDGSGLGGNLVLATDKTGTYNDIVVAVGSFYSNSEVARFHGNTSNSGYLTLAYTTSATSTTTGALRVAGGIGVSGNVFAGAIYSDNYKYANGSPYSSTTVGNTSEITANIASGYNVGLSLTTTGVTASTYGSSTAVPVITVDSKGRITGVTTSSISGSITMTGDVTGTGTTGSSFATTLSSTGVTAGNYGSATLIPTVVVDAKGRISSITTNAISSTVTLTGDVTGTGSTGTGFATTLAASGVTAGNYGSATSIPTIVVDAKGRITSVTSNAVSTTISLSGTSGSGSVAGGGTLTFAGGNGFTATVSSSTVTLSSAQDIRTSASPTFAGGSFTGNVTRSSRPLITNFTGTSAPSSPIQGDEWFNSSNGVLYKYVNDGTSNNWINISSALTNSNTAAVANTLALRDSSANLYAANFIGVASSAKYADLAEIYTSDDNYVAGTVVVFGGTKEITVTTKTHDTRVAGVISTDPAYLMNSETNGLPVALTGRVPCRVRGPVRKGDVLVASAIRGVAETLDDTLYRPGCILGKALGEILANEITTIEIVVGRF